MTEVGAVIAAAGRSRRMGGVNKLFASLAGRPLLLHSLLAFEASPQVERVVVVLAEEALEEGWRLAGGLGKVVALCKGGERRQDSVAAGLRALGPCQWVVVHDGARPLVTPGLVAAGLRAAQETGAAIAALPIADTVKRVLPQGQIAATLRREELWAAQTPQVFRYELLLRAHQVAQATQAAGLPPQHPEAASASLQGEATDDAALVERLGHPVKVFLGSARNIKVTTPEDLALAEALLALPPPPGPRR